MNKCSCEKLHGYYIRKCRYHIRERRTIFQIYRELQGFVNKNIQAQVSDSSTGWKEFKIGVIRYTIFIPPFSVKCDPGYREISGHLGEIDTPAVPLKKGTYEELFSVLNQINNYIVNTLMKEDLSMCSNTKSSSKSRSGGKGGGKKSSSSTKLPRSLSGKNKHK